MSAKIEIHFGEIWHLNYWKMDPRFLIVLFFYVEIVWEVNMCWLIVWLVFLLWRLTETILWKNFQIHFYMKNSVLDTYWIVSSHALRSLWLRTSEITRLSFKSVLFNTVVRSMEFVWSNCLSPALRYVIFQYILNMQLL